MKATGWVFLGALAVGGFFAWKYRAKLLGTVAPDPTVATVAGSTFGAAQDVPGTVSGAIGSSPLPSVSAVGNYNPLTSSPALNAALTGAAGPNGALGYGGGAVA